MTSSTRIRFGALAAAATVVAGGFFAAAPANAATGTITVANTTYTAGDWGTGLGVTGAGFTAGSVVTVTVAQTGIVSDPTQNATGALPPADTHQVTADATGAFTETYTPGFVPFGGTVTVTATSDKGDTSNTVPLTVLAPKSIQASATSVTTAELVDKNHGVEIAAAGYTPGEKVTATVAYDGDSLPLSPATAAADGSVYFGFYLGAGVATAGTLTVTVAGADSKVSQSVSVQVTGPDITVTDTQTPTVVQTPPSAAKPAAPKPSPRLPVVSG